jgi:hypothetical protein
LAQHVFDAFDELALDTVGERIQWVPLLGSTEGGVITACRDADVARAGGIGLPVPGVTLSSCRATASWRFGFKAQASRQAIGDGRT